MESKAGECSTQCEGSQSVLDGEPEIVRAVHEGDEERALELLAAGMDPNLRTKAGYPLLHMAALSDLALLTAKLLALGADHDAVDRDGSFLLLSFFFSSRLTRGYWWCAQALRHYIMVPYGKRQRPLKPSLRC